MLQWHQVTESHTHGIVPTKDVHRTQRGHFQVWSGTSPVLPEAVGHGSAFAIGRGRPQTRNTACRRAALPARPVPASQASASRLVRLTETSSHENAMCPDAVTPDRLLDPLSLRKHFMREADTCRSRSICQGQRAPYRCTWPPTWPEALRDGDMNSVGNATVTRSCFLNSLGSKNVL